MVIGQKVLLRGWQREMILKIKCACGTTNIVEAETKMLAKEIDLEKSPLFGNEMLEVEDHIVDEKYCRGCGKRLSF